MHESKQSAFILRALLMALVISYGAALYFEWRPLSLSVEATKYREIVWQVAGGFGIGNLIQKVGLVIGSCMVLLGAVLLFLRQRIGLYFLLFSAPTVVASILVNATSSAYPDVELTTTMLLSCVASALWGSVITCVMLQRRRLFERETFSSGVSSQGI
jgi:hypothetical protein